MAYITKEQVTAKNLKLKAINAKYGVKARFSGSNSSQLRLKVTESTIDFIGNTNALRIAQAALYDEEAHLANNGYTNVNHYYVERAFSGIALDYLTEAYDLMLEGHFDKSDSQTDYFHCAWYNDITIGTYDKPYKLTGV